MKMANESMLHYAIKRDLVDALTERGLAALPEHRIYLGTAHAGCTLQRWATVDVAIPSKRIALEVDVAKPNGTSWLVSSRNDLLEEAGWKIVRLPVWDWERRRLLQQVMEKVTQ